MILKTNGILEPTGHRLITIEVNGFSQNAYVDINIKIEQGSESYIIFDDQILTNENGFGTISTIILETDHSGNFAIIPMM